MFPALFEPFVPLPLYWLPVLIACLLRLPVIFPVLCLETSLTLIFKMLNSAAVSFTLPRSDPALPFTT